MPTTLVDPIAAKVADAVFRQHSGHVLVLEVGERARDVTVRDRHLERKGRVSLLCRGLPRKRLDGALPGDHSSGEECTGAIERAVLESARSVVSRKERPNSRDGGWCRSHRGYRRTSSPQRRWH